MIFGILHNAKLDRFHPILFRMAPMPGNADGKMDNWRFKSAGHHTEGFTSLDDAQGRVRSDCTEHGWKDSGRVYEWNGEDVPVMVDFFPCSLLLEPVS